MFDVLLCIVRFEFGSWRVYFVEFDFVGFVCEIYEIYEVIVFEEGYVLMMKVFVGEFGMCGDFDLIR